MSFIPSRERIGQLWERFSDYAIVLVLVLALGGLAFGIYNSYVAKENSQEALDNAAQAKITAQKDLESQNNHHAATVKSNAEQKALLEQQKVLLNKLNDEAQVIEYEGGVITYQNGVILQSHQETSAAIAEVQALTSGAVKAIEAGQAQVNVYLRYLACLGTNPGNEIVCGAAPPLPSTS